MSGQANITSTDAVRHFKLAAQKFELSVRDALIQLQLEVRRAVDWIENDRARYWPREVRRASDSVSEAKIALQRCELSISGDDRKSCSDEKKALEAAKRRLELAEQKVRAVRHWRLKIKHEAEEFDVQAAKMSQYLDGDWPRTLAALDRMAKALEKYVQRRVPGEITAAANAATKGSAPDTGGSEAGGPGGAT